MTQPGKRRGTRVCLAVTKDGVTLYGNKAAFKTLADWMQWIADSDPAEHYECHVVWHLLSHLARRPNIVIRYDKQMRRIFAKRATPNVEQFELTFMQVENSDLNKLERSSSVPE